MSLRSHEAAACAVIAIGVCGVLVGSLLVESMRNGQSSAKATVSTAQSTEEIQAQTEPTQMPAPTPEPEPVVQTVHFSATGDNLIHEGIYNQARARGSEYGVVYLDQRDVIEKQITDMRPNCDVLVVSCHWGVEGSHTVTDAQRETAQWLADQGADLIIGTHPHVTQTAQWLTGTNENKSFVAYSLGNFINAQDMPDNMIGAILDVTFQKTTAADGTVTVEIQNPVLHPVITQYEPHYANIRVYLYKDYTDELGAAHGNFALSRASIEQVLNGSIDSEFLSLE